MTGYPIIKRQDCRNNLEEANHMKQFQTIALVMMCLSLFIFAASADLVSVGNGQVSNAGDLASVGLVYDSAPAGLAGYSINVNVTDPTVAVITGVSFPAWATMKDNSTLPSSSCNLKATDLNEQVQAGATSIPLCARTGPDGDRRPYQCNP
jgi:hypothetical protein